MSNQSIEETLRQAAARWRRLRFLQHSATLGVVLGTVVLLLGVAAHRGGIEQPAVFQTWLFLFSAVALFAWAAIALNVVFGEVERGWLATRLERGQPLLQDRLNTLVHLEKEPTRPFAHAFHHKIHNQAQLVLTSHRASPRFSPVRAIAHLGACIAVLALTVWFYDRYAPYQKLVEARKAKKVEPAFAKVESPAELAKPETSVAETKENWGEVLITDPARDLQVTKVDVVPLQIEAAANEALRKVGWLTAVNGGEEKPNELPAPAEPRYAVYQPTVYLDEYRLSDWDVLTYYAKANTEGGRNLASQVYFLEVRPFREDILKLPGGEGGQAYECLNELTALINQQQHVIRETHKHVQQPPSQPNLADQDRTKLADAESDLSRAAKHLYTRMATEMENKPIGQALDQLAKAEKSLASASESLSQVAMNEAPNRERKALADLIAARKSFQKAVSDNPKAFEGEKPEATPPTAERQDQLKQIAEYRNEEKAARDFVQQTLDKERSIARQAASGSRTNYSRLRAEEQGLQNSLEFFRQDHPQVFNQLRPETDAARQAMEQATRALANANVSASKPTQAAVEKLEQLRSALQNLSANRQLADAYKLKDMLDRQIQSLGQCQSSPDSFSSADTQKLAGQSQSTLEQLKQAADQKTGSDAFGPALGEALSDLKMQSMRFQLGDLAQAETGEAKQMAAGQAKESLSQVSAAFEHSQPKALQQARKTDALKPAEQGSLERGLGQLGSLLQQMQQNRSADPKDQAKQGQEALFNLQTGMRSQHGSNERGQEILLKLAQELKPEAGQPIDLENLKKLMAQLQNFSLELTDKAKQPDKPEVTNIDPANVPAAYRGRIQKYFQKLSEK